MLSAKSMPDFLEGNNLPHIIPQPRKLKWGSSYVQLNEFKFESWNVPEHICGLYRNALPLNEQGGKLFKLTSTPSVKPEGYNLKIAENEISVCASDERGFFYALQTIKQLKLGNLLVCVKIEDFPQLAIRGFHFNLESVEMLDFNEVRRIIEMLGKFKINTLLLEYADKFPFTKHPAISSVAAFRRDEIQEFERLAKANCIDIIPLVQSLGHVRHVLRHPQYRYLLETEVEKLRREQFCPLKEDAFELFREMASEIMAAHPESRYLHIGGDETGSLGKCPDCASAAARYGTSRLYADYMNKVCAWVKSRGRIPVLWDDIISNLQYTEIADLLDKDAVIMYWDYWTTKPESPLLVARGTGYGVVHDKRWDGEWSRELQEPEKTVLAKFSKGIDLEKELAAGNYLKIFGRYLGRGFPKYVNAFPYIGFYRDKGFRVIGAPTTLGNGIDDTFGLPNYSRFLCNIREFSNKCVKEKLLGLVTTAWYNFPPEILSLGIMATAQHTWRGNTP
ncbi:MAG: family 20 glycosylhydrolase [Victivallaceae bacterium]|nr:family 20 glycosylhydrolase [Victivallaceae bacterium]